MVIAHLRGLPLVVTFHNEIVGRGPTHLVARAYNLTLERLVLSEAGRVLVARDAYLPPTLAAAHRRISFIPPGTDTHCFVPMVREPLCDIAFLSVLDDFHHYKGVEVLFKAVKMLSMSRPVSLTIGGDGPLRTHYEEMAKEYGIRSHVRFSGFIPDSDLPAFYSSARVFVLPSTDATREGFGIVLLEAMACSRPVIATTIAGMAAQIRAYGAGCIVPVGDASALAVAIASVLDDEEAGALMGAAGRRLVCDEFSWESVAAKVEAVYQEIC
jgi:glycosyltransferase involved in cell wall biosynthesis